MGQPQLTGLDLEKNGRSKDMMTQVLGTERPCRYIRRKYEGERRGIIQGIGPDHYLIRDSEELTTHKIKKSDVKEVALWGPDDIPKDYFRKRGIRV